MDAHESLYETLDGPVKPLRQPPVQQDATATAATTARAPKLPLFTDVKETGTQFLRGLGEGGVDLAASPLHAARTAQQMPPFAPGSSLEAGRSALALLTQIPGFSWLEGQEAKEKRQLATFYGEGRPGQELARTAGNVTAQGAVTSEIGNFISGYQSGKSVQKAFQELYGSAEKVPSPLAAGLMKTATGGMVEDAGTQVALLNYRAGRAVQQFKQNLLTGNVPKFLDRYVLQNRGLFHGSKDPVALAITGPGAQGVQVSDELGRPVLRTTPAVRGAMTFASRGAYPNALVKVTIDPTALDRSLNFRDPKNIIQWQRTVNTLQRMGIHEPLNLTNEAWHGIPEAQTTAAAARAYDLLDARGASDAIEELKARVMTTMKKQVGTDYFDAPKKFTKKYQRTFGSYPTEDLALAAGEHQVAIQNPNVIRELEIQHYTFGKKSEGIPAQHIPLARVHLENGVPQRIEMLTVPKNLRLPTGEETALRRLQEELHTRAGKMGYERMGNNYRRVATTARKEALMKLARPKPKTMDEEELLDQFNQGKTHP